VIKETADIHVHAYSPMEIAHMCDVSGLGPAEVLLRLRAAGLDSVPGRRQRSSMTACVSASPEQAPVMRWVEIIEAAHRIACGRRRR